jgi:hypothetical protein
MPYCIYQFIHYKWDKKHDFGSCELGSVLDMKATSDKICLLLFDCQNFYFGNHGQQHQHTV